jgi:lipopolysaccharide heptosyltransferase II
MTTDWSNCKKVLCIRPDNMGDLLMSSPAIRAIKETFQCQITLLTSSMAANIAAYIDEIDEIITYDLPWVKLNSLDNSESFFQLIETLKEKQFDAAVIFTVYSQNPLPSAMVAYLAGIPRRLAYCRENPYDLLTNWVPEKEPYEFVVHQVRRDLALVKTIGAGTDKEDIVLRYPEQTWSKAKEKLQSAGLDITRPYILMHAGVSEKKREFSLQKWIETGKRLVRELNQQLILTGSKSEKSLTDSLKDKIGKGAFSMAGLLSLEEFISLVAHAPMIISVNTGPIHIAAGTGTPVIVLYALTNPQHLPWKVKGKAFFYDVPENLRSKNEVIRFVHDHLFYTDHEEVTSGQIVDAVKDILDGAAENIPEMIPLRNYEESKSTVSL